MESIRCKECGTQFRNLQFLRNHVRKFHPTKVNELAPYKKTGKVYKFSCNGCGRHFNHKNNFAYHQRKCTHLTTREPKKLGNFTCPLCSAKILSDEFEKHLKRSHDLTLDKENLEFPSYDEFLEWKNDIEHTEKTKFIKISGKKKTSRSERQYFYCHHSGYFHSKGTGKRQLKISIKMDSKCPASIKLTTDIITGSCKIVYTKTHVGHKTELCYLTITKKHSEALAAKIAQEIPLSDILDEVRDSISNEQLERLHLLTKKDLLNIETVFSSKNDSCKQASIDYWVASMKNDSCVRFYKPQDTISERYPVLKNEDFMLIIMNESQCEILQKFGADCICIDGTLGLNSYSFEVVTLMVINEMRQAFPCAFLVCNRTDQAAISIFYENIKKCTGPLKPDVFMSDMADSFYNAWVAVMELPARILYCSWHVDRAWRKNLNRVETMEKRIEVYHMLRMVLQERDIPKFENIFRQALKVLIEDPCTQEFGKYFKENFSTNTASWAYCYRMHAGVSINVHLERMHKTIKYLYLQGSNVARLDKSVFILLKFIKDRLFDRLVMIHQEKLTIKIQTIGKRHTASLQLDPDKIVDDQNRWRIHSATKPTFNSIQENLIDCKCGIVCEDCDTCIHRYTCSCFDNRIKWNMCKHIHLLCMKRIAQQQMASEMPASMSSDEEDRKFEFEIDDTAEDDVQKLVTQLSGKTRIGDQLLEKKQDLSNKFNELIDYVESAEELGILENCLTSLKITIDALRKCKKNVVDSSSTSVQHREPAVLLPKRRHSPKKNNNSRKKVAKPGAGAQIKVPDETLSSPPLILLRSLQ